VATGDTIIVPNTLRIFVGLQATAVDNSKFFISASFTPKPTLGTYANYLKCSDKGASLKAALG
jgi:hypothetical protein